MSWSELQASAKLTCSTLVSEGCLHSWGSRNSLWHAACRQQAAGSTCESSLQENGCQVSNPRPYRPCISWLAPRCVRTRALPSWPEWLHATIELWDCFAWELCFDSLDRHRASGRTCKSAGR